MADTAAATAEGMAATAADMEAADTDALRAKARRF